MIYIVQTNGIDTKFHSPGQAEIEYKRRAKRQPNKSHALINMVNMYGH